MKTKISPVLLCILSVLALILVCFLVVPSEPADPHAGHDHATGATADPHAGHNHGPEGNDHGSGNTATNPVHNKKAKDSYSFVKNKDGSYSYNVLARSGIYILQENNVARPADFTAVSDDVLKVHGQAGAGLSARWAIFCNVQTAKKSKTFGWVLGSGKTQVAYVDHRTNALHVFVEDQFDETAAPQVYTLEGIKTVNGQEPDIDCEQKGSTLKVTYLTEDGKKTINIKLK